MEKMTSTSASDSTNNGHNQSSGSQISSTSSSSAAKSRQPANQATSGATSLNQQASNYPCSTSIFQQVKQTQASLARLSRVQQLNHNNSQTNQSSQQPAGKQSPTSLLPATTTQTSTTTRLTTFVDCLIRRFKDCFNEDCCTVPMFVVGNLSPGSDGTHLILPPCVSLGGQNISRFASPKNMRLINSLRESCRSIEELDLGGNKLTDLIEVYKILQCTPNLKFLNLSENDLSRSSPVAMASATCLGGAGTVAANAQTSPSFSITSGPVTSSLGVNAAGQHHWSPSFMTLNSNNRSCLAPINQNQTSNSSSNNNNNNNTNHQHQQVIKTRRHSTLGQADISGTRSVTRARAGETQRLVATAAVAQSKKTSPSVAIKLTACSTVATGVPRERQTGGSGRRVIVDNSLDREKDLANKNMRNMPNRATTGQQRHQASSPSTMHLTRSLSSLSAKDVRAASSSLSRLSSHRTGARRTVGLRSSANVQLAQQQSGLQRHQVQGKTGVTNKVAQSKGNEQQSSGGCAKQQMVPTTTGSSSITRQQQQQQQVKVTQTTSLPKLFVESIEESDDVDMGEHQQNMLPFESGTSGISHEASGQRLAILPSSSHSPTTTVQQQQSSCLVNNANQNQLRSLSLHNAVSNSMSTTSGNIITKIYPAGASSSQTTSSSSSANYRRTFESIKALALNNTGCQWRVVCSILSRMPNLEELHLSLNNYKHIDLDPNEFRHPSLKRLYLCNNPKLTNWEELDKLLLAFPSLEALSIADCNISQIPDNLDRAREWRKLCGLNINGWPIKEWPVIERLNQLPSLIDLKCRNLEILSTIDEPRHHLIARLPKLQRLNGSEIEEREHAEKAFLRFFMANSHLERPPRFHELIQIHGEVISTVDVNVDLSPPSHASVRIIFLNKNFYRKENDEDIFMSEDFLTKLMDNVEPVASNGCNESISGNLENMEVSVTCVDNDENKPITLFKDESQEVVAIDVDLRQSVRKFKSTLASLFGLSSQNVILYYIDSEMVGLMGPELIKHNQKKLWNYNVQDGDQFIVEER